MTKKKITFILITIICFSLGFTKEKISENSTSLNYSYNDWKEFYSDIIEASKKELYQYSYMRNTVSEGEIKNILSSAKNNIWNLISHKEMNGRDMVQSFYIVSPNGHITVLILTNNPVTLSKYEIAYKSSSSTTKSVEYISEPLTATQKQSQGKTTSNIDPKKTEPNLEEINKNFIKKISIAFDEQLFFLMKKFL